MGYIAQLGSINHIVGADTLFMRAVNERKSPSARRTVQVFPRGLRTVGDVRLGRYPALEDTITH